MTASASIPPVFKNSDQQELLESVGVVQIPMLAPSEVERAQSLFDECFPDRPDHLAHGFFTSVAWPELGVKSRIDTELRDLLLPKLDRTLCPVRALNFGLQIKGTGPNSRLELHQDWSVTDEDQFRSVTFWIPLVDSVPSNGTVYYLLGDPDRFRDIRCGSVESPYFAIKDEIQGLFSPQVVRAGHALFWDPAVLHLSPPNLSSDPRVSIVSTLVQAEAPVQLYYRNPERVGSLEVYRVPDDFWLHYEDFVTQKNMRPDGTLIGTVPDRIPAHVDLATFTSMLERTSR